MHLAIIGTGRVGQMLAYTLLFEKYITKLSLSDTKPHLTQAVAEELRHVAAGNNRTLEIAAFTKNELVTDADIIMISAGVPRNSQTKDRRDLVKFNAKIIKSIAISITAQNPRAKYIIVTNPVDAMASIFTHYSKAKFVVSTGTSLDSLRFRSELAKNLRVPVSEVAGFVGGEHGVHAVFLWSTVKIFGKNLDTYLKTNHLIIDKEQIITSVKTISKLIIDIIGGTAQGPATAFCEIVRAIALGQKRLIPVAVPHQFPKLPQPIYITIPLRLGKKIGPDIEKNLTLLEKAAIQTAAQEIYQTYQEALTVTSLES